ncbi:MAG: hypothetical protein FH748_03245 [Balneolaceae bacterium]|nr:hypothetical protein [Balneolaceae bacterium]
MRFRILFFTIAFISISCVEQKSKTTSRILSFDDVINRSIHLDEALSFSGREAGLSFIDIVVSDSGQIFGFDQNSGSIVKIKNGKIIEKTGGIGRGPNEYNVEAKPSLIVCNEQYLLAFELKAARFQVYDLDLNYKRTVLLDAIPEEIICYSNDEIAVFYHLKNGIEIMKPDGDVTSTLRFEENWAGSNLSFKEVAYTNDRFFISYLFDPKLAVYSEGSGMSELYRLPVVDSDSVKFATKNISRSGNDIHLYFYDDHPDTPKENRKKGHVFSDSGKYKYTYTLPGRINYYKVFGKNKLVAVEDTLQRIVVYSFKLDE